MKEQPTLQCDPHDFRGSVKVLLRPRIFVHLLACTEAITILHCQYFLPLSQGVDARSYVTVVT